MALKITNRDVDGEAVLALDRSRRKHLRLRRCRCRSARELRFSAYIEMMLVWRKSRLSQLRYLGLGPFQVAKSLFTLTTRSAGILHG